MSIPRTQLPPDFERTLERPIDRIQDISRRTAVAVNQMGAPPLGLGPVAFTAGQILKLEHKLGRQPENWWPVDVTVGYGSFRRTDWNDKFIYIQSENACTATFKVS